MKRSHAVARPRPPVTHGHNAGSERGFGGEGMTVGLGFPLTGARRETPDHEREPELATRAEEPGFDALWARDVPCYQPRVRDAGQTFGPWRWLGCAAAGTDWIPRCTARVVLTRSHPLHVAKQAGSPTGGSSWASPPTTGPSTAP